MNHVDVVSAIKNLPPRVTIVCARLKSAKNPFMNVIQQELIREHCSSNKCDRSLIKAKSDHELFIIDMESKIGFVEKAKGRAISYEDSNKFEGIMSKCHSWEPISRLIMWTSDATVVELCKGKQGLGFSLLEYQVVF